MELVFIIFAYRLCAGTTISTRGVMFLVKWVHQHDHWLGTLLY